MPKKGRFYLVPFECLNILVQNIFDVVRWTLSSHRSVAVMSQRGRNIVSRVVAVVYVLSSYQTTTDEKNVKKILYRVIKYDHVYFIIIIIINNIHTLFLVVVVMIFF